MPLLLAGESAGLPQQPRRLANTVPRICCTSAKGTPISRSAEGRCDRPIAPSAGARPARNLRHLCGTINVAELRFCQKSVRVLKSTCMCYRRDQRSMHAAALASPCHSAAKKIKCQLFTPDPTPPLFVRIRAIIKCSCLYFLTRVQTITINIGIIRRWIL